MISTNHAEIMWKQYFNHQILLRALGQTIQTAAAAEVKTERMTMKWTAKITCINEGWQQEPFLCCSPSLMVILPRRMLKLIFFHPPVLEGNSN